MRLLLRVAAFLGKFLVGTALALAVFLAGTYFHVRGALPSYSGTMDVAGLKAPVEILRDKNAVPHIIAGSIEDASFALGYVHAQDRFWQMELMRRIGQGRLAELVPPRLVGSGLVDSDRTMRGLGVYRRASESVNALSPAMRTQLDAYAAGVNAWISHDDQKFGLELTLIKLLSAGRYRPDPWRPADSLVWAKLMALGLDGNWRAELLRLRLSQKIGEDGVKFLIEPSGDSKDSTLSMVMAAVKDIDLDRIFHGTDNEVTRKREASNEWVLSGAHAVWGGRFSPTTRISDSPFPASGTSPAWSDRASTSAAPPRRARPPSCWATMEPSAGDSRPRTSTARTYSSSASIRPIQTATSHRTAPDPSPSETRPSRSPGAIRSRCGCARRGTVL